MFDSIRDKSIMDFGLKKWWGHCYIFEKYILHKKAYLLYILFIFSLALQTNYTAVKNYRFFSDSM